MRQLTYEERYSLNEDRQLLNEKFWLAAVPFAWRLFKGLVRLYGMTSKVDDQEARAEIVYDALDLTLDISQNVQGDWGVEFTVTFERTLSIIFFVTKRDTTIKLKSRGRILGETKYNSIQAQQIYNTVRNIIKDGPAKALELTGRTKQNVLDAMQKIRRWGWEQKARLAMSEGQYHTDNGIVINPKLLPEDAKSKAQQRLFGMAHAVNKGDTELSDLPANVQDDIEDIIDSMDAEEIEKYASTSHDDLDEGVSEYVDTLTGKSLDPVKNAFKKYPEVRNVRTRGDELIVRHMDGAYKIHMNHVGGDTYEVRKGNKYFRGNPERIAYATLQAIDPNFKPMWMR